LREHGEDPQVADADHLTHIHRALKESLLPLKAMTADRADFVHREPPGKHPSLETYGAPLSQDGAESS
jgi:hypothetical protein